MNILVMIWLQWRTAITAKIIWRIVEVIIQVTGLERLKVPARAPAVFMWRNIVIKIVAKVRNRKYINMI